MSELKAKVEVKLTEKTLGCINAVACSGIIFTNILRWFVRSDKKEGIDGIPIMLFFVQTVLTIMFAVFVICGEFRKPLMLVQSFPLLVSRLGKGVLIILVTIPLIGPNFLVVLLCILICLICALSVWLGWSHGPVTLEEARNPLPIFDGTTAKETNAGAELPNVQNPPPGTSAAPSLTGGKPQPPPDNQQPPPNYNQGYNNQNYNQNYNQGYDNQGYN